MTTAIRVRPVQRTAPCAECQAPILAGRTYCSIRCRNAADCHDDYDDSDGDL